VAAAGAQAAAPHAKSASAAKSDTAVVVKK